MLALVGVSSVGGFVVRGVAVLGVCGLLVVGCAGPVEDASVASAPSASPSVSASASGPVVTGLGSYGFVVGGTSGVVSLPGTSDPRLSEALTIAGAGPAPVSVSVEVDNRQGAADVHVDAVSVYTADGGRFTYLSAHKFLDSVDITGLDTDAHNRVIAAYNVLNDPVRVGESRSVTMAGTDPLPADIVRVTVSDAYGDETQATKQ